MSTFEIIASILVLCFAVYCFSEDERLAEKQKDSERQQRAREVVKGTMCTAEALEKVTSVLGLFM